MATQNFKGNHLLISYREGKKHLTLVVCFFLLLKREKKCLTLAAYFLRLGAPSLPACYPLKPVPEWSLFCTFSPQAVVKSQLGGN